MAPVDPVDPVEPVGRAVSGRAGRALCPFFVGVEVRFQVALVPAGVVTVTSTVPAASCAGALTTTSFGSDALDGRGRGAEVHRARAAEVSPLIVTVVPPAAGPEAGLSDSTVGPLR